MVIVRIAAFLLGIVAGYCARVAWARWRERRRARALTVYVVNMLAETRENCQCSACQARRREREARAS